MKNGTLNFVGEIDYANDFSPEKEIVLRNGSSLEFLKEIPNEAIKLIITSPPYNIGKEYETRQSIEKYLEEHKD